jgi:hypothetical protein
MKEPVKVVIQPKELEAIFRPTDCKKIQSTLHEIGHDLTLIKCQELWQEMSRENYCASWITVNGCSKKQIIDSLEDLL